MRKISEIYTEYKIPQNLQMHMLRVTAIAFMICDNFEEPLPKEEIVTACLLHDMGNIIKFDFKNLVEFFEPEGVEYWQNIKKEYIEKYGSDEHEAIIKIIKELGMSDAVINLANQNKFSNLCLHRDIENVAVNIVHYADSRVDPYGIVSYDERMEEARKRYQNRNEYFIPEEERKKLVNSGKEIEKQIFAKCKIKPEDINNESVKNIILELKDFMIHSTGSGLW